MKFTRKEDNYIRRNCKKIPAKRMSRILSRGESSVRQRMALLKIKVPKICIDKFKKDSQFKPGHTAINKGKKQTQYMSKGAINRTKRTRFKKGHTPQNTLYDGAITIRTDKTGRKYYWIRISKMRWKMLHVVLWQKFNGKVPAGKIVVFKNKNQGDVRIENLELITLEENMRRNTIHRYPIELKTTIRALSKLRRILETNGKK